MFRNRKAQSTLEYAILIGFVAAALITTQIVLKRHYQGKLRESAESMGEQFSPGYTTYDYSVKSRTVSNEKTQDGITTTTITGQSNDKSGSEEIAVQDSEYWPK